MTERTSQSDVLTVADLEIRPAEHLALARGRALQLSARELQLLTAMAREEGRVLPREELYMTVWGGRLRPDDRSVDVYVHKLRSKLAAALPGWRFIHTHFGFGYRFAAEQAAGPAAAGVTDAFTPFSQAGHNEVTGSQVGS